MQINAYELPLNRTIMLVGKRQSGKSALMRRIIIQQRQRMAQKQRLLTLLKNKIDELEMKKLAQGDIASRVVSAHKFSILPANILWPIYLK